MSCSGQGRWYEIPDCFCGSVQYTVGSFGQGEITCLPPRKMSYWKSATGFWKYDETARLQFEPVAAGITRGRHYESRIFLKCQKTEFIGFHPILYLGSRLSNPAFRSPFRGSCRSADAWGRQRIPGDGMDQGTFPGSVGLVGCGGDCPPGAVGENFVSG